MKTRMMLTGVDFGLKNWPAKTTRIGIRPHRAFYRRTHKEDYNDALFSKLILDENNTVLDVGCGEGSITVPLAKRVKKVIGVDSSPKMLEYLEKEPRKIRSPTLKQY